MSRSRLNLRTRPLTSDARGTGSPGRDLFDSRAFAAATNHPFEPGGVTPACAAEDPELFWPGTDSEAAQAKAVCRSCPLIRSCLAVAQQRGEWGVWGGELLARGRVSTELPGNVRPVSPAAAKSA